MPVDFTHPFVNPVPLMRPGWPRPYWDYFNAPGRTGYNPDYAQPGDPCGHKGVDLAPDPPTDGQPIFSAHTSPAIVHGVITPATNPQAGYGVDMVEQAVGGWWATRYLHMPAGAVLVRVGQIVQPGQRIGSIGHTGNANYPHTHFEIRWLDSLPVGGLAGKGVPLDPLRFGILGKPKPLVWPVLLREGDTHQAVMVLRALLFNLGYGGGSLLTSGLFDSALGVRVAAFQSDFSCQVDRIVGPQTRAALSTATGQVLTPGGP